MKCVKCGGKLTKSSLRGLIYCTRCRLVDAQRCVGAIVLACERLGIDYEKVRDEAAKVLVGRRHEI